MGAVNALAATLALAAALKVGAAPPQQPRFGAEASLIEVEAVVTGPAGAPVLDLGPDEFVLLEDGKPQAISHVALHRAATPATGAAQPAPGPAEPAARVAVQVAPRLVVLAIDELHLVPLNLQRAREALKRFVTGLPPGDRVAIFTSSGLGGLLQPFTEDREVLRRAIDRVAPRATGPEGFHDIPRLGLYQASLIERRDRDALRAAVAEVLRDDPALPATLATSMVEIKARTLVTEARRSAKAALDTLRAHMLLLRQLRGRKLVVFVSDGFYLDGQSSADLREVSGLAAHAGAVFYPLDMRGLEAKLASGDVSEGGRVLAFDAGRYRRIEFEEMRGGLNALARDTGGLPLFNYSDPAAGLARALADSEVWYRVAYSPARPPRPGEYRKVELKVTRPGVSVRTFKGYLAGVPAKDRPAQDPLMQALLSLVPVQDIAPELALGWLDTAEGPQAVVATRLLAGAWAGAERGRRTVPVKLRGVIFDADNQPVAGFEDEREVRLDSADPEPAITFSTRTLLKPGRHQVRVAVLAGDRLGTAAGAIDVPDVPVTTLAVSDIFVSYDEESPPAPISPGRRFRRSEEIEFVLYVSNARASAERHADLGFDVRMRAGANEVGASAFEIVIPRDQPPQPRLVFDRRLPLAGFEPGAYTLAVRITDRVAGTETERELSFVIEE